jgi:hypothetical protein
MRTILLSSTAILAAVAIAATGVTDSVQAASRFDGSWTVQITTRRGACDPNSSFGVEIHDGVVSGAASGRVSKSGAVSVSVSSGGSYASGSGRLSTSSGAGSWHGSRLAWRMLRNMSRRPSLRTAVTTNESDLAGAPCGDLTRVGGIPGMAVRSMRVGSATTRTVAPTIARKAIHGA